MAPHKPKPFVAIVLALFSPGLGHLYLGKKGWFFGALIALPIVLSVGSLALTYLPGLFGPTATIAIALTWLVAWPLHANRLAVRASTGGHRVPITKWSVLVLATIGTAVWFELYRAVSPFRSLHATSRNMEPTIMSGDRFVVRRAPSDAVAREDIVIYTAADMPGTPVIGRVVAMEGDLVEMSSGTLTINGVIEAATYANRSGDDRLAITDWGPKRVPQGSVFILGDHRNMSLDSRERGPVPLENVTDVALRIYFSKAEYQLIPRWDRIGKPLR